MRNIYENIFSIENNCIQNLLNLGFQKKYDIDESYIYNFPVLKYGGETVLHGRIIAYTDTNEIKIDVIDNAGCAYAPFYRADYGRYEEVLEKINKGIMNEFKRIGISKKERKNENDSKH